MMNKRSAAGALSAVALCCGVGFGAHTYAATGTAKATKQIVAKLVNGAYAFSPKTTKVAVGTKVTWTNPSDAPHTVTGTGSWTSFNKQLPTGKTVSFTFKKAGRYNYYCAIHPYMKGTIVVK